jgi:hypothetical protein
MVETNTLAYSKVENRKKAYNIEKRPWQVVHVG